VNSAPLTYLPRSKERLSESLKSLTQSTTRLLAPPPKLLVSQWADAMRILSRESSAEPGKWRTERAEYQRGMMDTVNDPAVETITIMSSARIGKTEILNNIIGYFIDQDPCPILMVQPTLDSAQHWSKDQFAPMVRDTPCIENKVAESKTRDESNTILHKSFPGGLIYITGANSPIGLRRSTIRVLLLDEVDAYPPSAGVEGDPVKLAKKRTVTFWNRKIIQTSTPTIKGISRIEAAWEESDQRLFHVPCTACGMFIVLHWGQLKFDKSDLSQVYYECEHCHAHLLEKDKFTMIREGRWIPTLPERGSMLAFTSTNSTPRGPHGEQW